VNISINDEIVMAGIMGRLSLRECCNSVSAAYVLSLGHGSHFLSQNTAIDQGTVSGVKMNLKVLGIGDGLTVRIYVS